MTDSDVVTQASDLLAMMFKYLIYNDYFFGMNRVDTAARVPEEGAEPIEQESPCHVKFV
ncbi:hypothetical protein [Pseudomonas sp. NPDC008258]|uniref:hypothetical protein n=1 Tax=Pseudomonas sp. NPDC008258 TaxID=3364418 RepID=UPI0036EBD9E6